MERAIEQLGYIRHEAARHLRAGYSSTVGLLLLDAWNPGFIEVARGVEDTTSSRGWTVLLSNSARDSEREQTYLRLFAEGRLAGLIVVPHDRFADDLHRIRSGGAAGGRGGPRRVRRREHVRGGGRRHRRPVSLRRT